jgi:N-acetylglucosamine kinase-like BadF-type ATPase
VRIDSKRIEIIGCEGTSGPSNIAAVSVAEAALHCHEAIAATGVDISDVHTVFAALAGWSFEARRKKLEAALSGLLPTGVNVRLAPDYVAAHAGAFDGGPGIVVIAGTGSIAYGVNRSGKKQRVGGFGYLIDDLGSGYGIGRQAIAAALRAFDNDDVNAPLIGLLRENTGLRDTSAIIQAVYGNEQERLSGGLGRVQIAALAEHVLALAAEGDPESVRIAMHSGAALAKIMNTVTTLLFAPSEAVPYGLVGSLWRSRGMLNDVFARSVGRFLPNAVEHDVAHDPVYGAAICARRLAVEP